MEKTTLRRAFFEDLDGNDGTLMGIMGRSTADKKRAGNIWNAHANKTYPLFPVLLEYPHWSTRSYEVRGCPEICRCVGPVFDAFRDVNGLPQWLRRCVSKQKTLNPKS